MSFSAPRHLAQNGKSHIREGRIASDASASKLKRLLLALGFLVGLCIFIYPLVSDLQYRQEQSDIADAYEKSLAVLAENQTDDGKDGQQVIEQTLKDAQNYNAALIDNSAYLTDPFEAGKMPVQVEPYSSLLNLEGNGMMGYIEIPKIDVKLSVYHGTSADVLQSGVGHLESTSLPVGGIGTHAVLSGHSGLAGKKLFTDLDQLAQDDVFYMHVLGQTLAYKVDQINVVTPDDVSDLSIVRDADYITLVTCTPYGVNDHRLLVRGERIDYEEAKALEAEQGGPGLTVWERYYLAIAAISLLVLVAVAAVALWRSRSNRAYMGAHAKGDEDA